jgi:hypothetical protein
MRCDNLSYERVFHMSLCGPTFATVERYDVGRIRKVKPCLATLRTLSSEKIDEVEVPFQHA